MPQPVTDERQGSQEPAQEERHRKYFSWVIIGTTVWGVFSASWLAYHSLQQDSWVRQILEDHFGAFIGIPIAALMAMCIVILLRFGAGPIEFEGLGLGFEFRGATGQVVFWIFCFLVIASALKLL